jgi:hypothetical protein
MPGSPLRIGRRSLNQQSGFTGELSIINSLQVKSERPLNVVVTSVGKTTQRMLAKKQAYKWAVNFKDVQVDKLCDSADLVYLSPDAEEVMEGFDPSFSNQR